MIRKCSIGVALLVLLLSAQAFSQSASIGGIVTDASGGVLPGTKVTVTHVATGIAKVVTTNNAGAYSVPGLQPGKYTVSAELSGFQTQNKTDVDVTAIAQLKMNFEMAIAARQDTVQVSVQTENILLESSSSVGLMLPDQKLQELPVVGSNVLDLIKVMGGVNPTDSPTFGADRTTFAGISAANVNLQRDGVTVNDVRWTTGLSSPVFLNPELVGEFKLVIAPVDAEMGRGSGQVQVITRSGANAFHGSGVWNIQNTALDSNQWSANKSGTQTNWRNQQEYTLSAGGPIIKNKTFFFASWDQQMVRIKENNVNVQVPTPCARKGIFRYFDGYSSLPWQRNPTTGFTRQSPSGIAVVNQDGTPIDNSNLTQPSYMGATTGQKANLEVFSIFGPLKKAIPATDYNCETVTVDSNGFADSSFVDYSSAYDRLRNTPDASGYVAKFLALTPQKPNNYQIGDGLNWAGYRWTRNNHGIDNVYGLGEGPERKSFNVKIDHNFNSSHRLSGSYSWETNHGTDAQPQWPVNSYGGDISRQPRMFSASLTSTLKPTLLNEARFGYSKTESFVVSPLHNTLNDSSTKLKNQLKQLYDYSTLGSAYNQDVPLLIGLGTQFQISGGSHPYGSGRGNFGTYWGGHDPRYSVADTVTWTRGKHSLKFGGEMQRTQSYQEINGSVSFASSNITSPYVLTGASANSPYSGLYAGSMFGGTYTLPGSTGYDASGVIGAMQNLQSMYAGSIASVGQYFFVNSPTATTYNNVMAGESMRITDYRQNMFNLFFKDDWKISDSLTLNLGVRYEWYGVPYLANGMTTGLKGGAMSVFGRSGNSFADWMSVTSPDQPYKGTDATIAFIGPDSPNPGQKLYNNDWNNFGPAVGFAWQLPWGGKGKTTVRGGYQMNFLTLGRADNAIVYPPGVFRDYTDNGGSWSKAYYLKDLGQLLPMQPATYMKTPAADPVIPVDQRQQGVTVFDPNMRTPYVQNLTLSVTRNVGSSLTVDVRYIGTLSRKQMGSVNLNTPNYFNNGLFEAFTLARAGKESPLLDKMFNGFATFYGNGATSGANKLRNTYDLDFTTFRTYSQLLADGNFQRLAAVLATMNWNTTYNPGMAPAPAYTAGGILRANGFAENFIYTSPQFTSATVNGNINHANYHSMQAQVQMRPKGGLALSGTYTWSRNLGMLTPQDPTNRAVDYGLLNTHRSHAFTSYGTYDLPFGPGKALFNNANPNVLGRLIGGWQLSWIHTMQTGRPAYVSALSSLYGTGTPNLLKPFDTKSGYVTWKPGAATGSYYNGRYDIIADPQCYDTNIVWSSSNCGLVGAYLTAAKPANAPSTWRPGANDWVWVNPMPGTRGNFSNTAITTPLVWNTDMALTKTVRISEGKSFSLRIDATNVFNHPQANRGTFGSSGSRVVAPGDFGGNITMLSLGPASFFSPNYAPGYLDAKVGARTFQGKLRLDF